jgi:transketolase
MQKDSRIILLTADLGYGILDKIKTHFPDRFINVGCSEQLMIGIAVGLSHNGFIPVCYSISSFLLYRPFEMIRNYINHEKTPIKLIGSGRDKDYLNLGITHWSCDDIDVLDIFENITCYKPPILDEEEIIRLLTNNQPVYINLSR